jgi:hypothetical protein
MFFFAAASANPTKSHTQIDYARPCHDATYGHHCVAAKYFRLISDLLEERKKHDRPVVAST